MSDKLIQGLGYGSLIQTAPEERTQPKVLRDEIAEIQVALENLQPPKIEGLPPREIIEKAKASLTPQIEVPLDKNYAPIVVKDIAALENFVWYGRDYPSSQIGYKELYKLAQERMEASKEAIAELGRLEELQIQQKKEMLERIEALKIKQVKQENPYKIEQNEKGWTFHWDADGNPDFFIPADDERVSILLRYAEELGKNIPKGQPVPELMLKKLPSSSGEFVSSLETNAEQREAILAILLNEAITNGISLQDGTHTDGFGVYNPKVSAALEKESSAKTQLVIAHTKLKGAHEYLANLHPPMVGGLPPQEIIDNAKTALAPIIGTLDGNYMQIADNNRANLEKFVSYDHYYPDIHSMHYKELYKLAQEKMLSLKDEQEKLKQLKAELDKNKKELLEKITALEKEVEERRITLAEASQALNAASPLEDLVSEKHSRPSNLGNFGKDETVCRHRGTLAMLLMERAGEDIMTVGGELTDGTSINVGRHLWAVSQKTGNLIEFSGSPQGSYALGMRNLQEADIIAGHSNVYQSSDGGFAVYGTGFIPELLAQTEQRYSNPAVSSNPMYDVKIANYDAALIEAMQQYKTQYPDNFKKMRLTIAHVEPQSTAVPEWTTKKDLDALSAAEYALKQLKDLRNNGQQITNEEQFHKAEIAYLQLREKEDSKYREYCDSSPMRTCWTPPTDRSTSTSRMATHP